MSEQKTAGTPAEYFDIKAQSIVSASRDGMISTIIMFQPTKDTLKRLRELKQGDSMKPLRMIDKWDDGTDDTHIGERPVNFINLSGSGDGRKTHTFTLIVCRAW